MVTALQFVISLRPSVPMAVNGTKPIEASNSEIRRWLEHSAIVISGNKPKPNDPVEFPITDVVFFPNSPKKKTTIW